ncbi:MmyB family transcriptional regulator [Williamsia sterculiae]|uniref:MmyB family transcriptional regulator n=1 Tax=Williamsia sterculiae TaxID=1344003 RepID=UPI0009705880|nr:helix-turn-helix domain-containing protein [Williamsia sterculiae]
MSLEELGRFLRARRNTLTPPGDLDAWQGRRVTGQRREEVADAAAISTDYYTKLEQGRASAPSQQVMASLGTVMGWSSSDREYADLLVRPPQWRIVADSQLQSHLVTLVREHHLGPALLIEDDLTISATNELADELFFTPHEIDSDHVNLARWIFTTEAARHSFVYWRARANATIAMLKLTLAQNLPDAKALSVIDDLQSTPAFNRLWRDYASHPPAHGAESLRVGRRGMRRTYLYTTLHGAGAPWPRVLVYISQ